MDAKPRIECLPGQTPDHGLHMVERWGNDGQFHLKWWLNDEILYTNIKSFNHGFSGMPFFLTNPMEAHAGVFSGDPTIFEKNTGMGLQNPTKLPGYYTCSFHGETMLTTQLFSGGWHMGWSWANDGYGWNDHIVNSMLIQWCVLGLYWNITNDATMFFSWFILEFEQKWGSGSKAQWKEIHAQCMG